MSDDYSISIFGNNKVEENGKIVDKVSRYILFGSWEDVKTFLREEHKIYTASKKDNLHIVSGLTNNNKRTKGSFDSTSCAYFMDIDNLSGMSLKEFHQKYKHLNHNYLVYNSASCRENNIRFRIVFNLDRPVLKEEFLHFWTNLNKLYDNLFDPQTNFIEKTNACPRTFEGALNFILECKGERVSVDNVKKKFIYIPKEKELVLPQSYFDYKKKKIIMSGKIISWNNIYDCPFINKQKLRSYQSIMDCDGSGRFDEFYRLMASISFTAYKMGYPLNEVELTGIMMEIDSNRHQFRNKTGSVKSSIRRVIQQAQVKC